VIEVSTSAAAAATTIATALTVEGGRLAHFSVVARQPAYEIMVVDSGEVE